MTHVRLPAARLLTIVPIVLALAFTMFAGYTLSPATPKASAALISAAKADSAVDWARTRKGSPYGYGSDGPHRFDCSGLTRWAFAKVGKWLPHSSSAQVSHTADRGARMMRLHHWSSVWKPGPPVGSVTRSACRLQDRLRGSELFR